MEVPTSAQARPSKCGLEILATIRDQTFISLDGLIGIGQSVPRLSLHATQCPTEDLSVGNVRGPGIWTLLRQPGVNRVDLIKIFQGVTEPSATRVHHPS